MKILHPGQRRQSPPPNLRPVAEAIVAHATRYGEAVQIVWGPSARRIRDEHVGRLVSWFDEPMQALLLSALEADPTVNMTTIGRVLDGTLQLEPVHQNETYGDREIAAAPVDRVGVAA